MSERENERNNPSQKSGFEQADNRNATNSDRDRQPTNAANQQRNENPQMGTQREGQRNDQSRTNDPTNPTGMKNADKTIPEVPQREEEHKRETPKADQRNQNDTNSPQL